MITTIKQIEPNEPGTGVPVIPVVPVVPVIPAQPQPTTTPNVTSNIGVIGPDGTVIYSPTVQPSEIAPVDPVNVIEIIPTEVIDVVSAIAPTVVLPSWSDIVSSLPQDLLDAYNRISPKDKLEMEEAIMEYVTNLPYVMEGLQYFELLNKAIEQSSLAISISTEAFPLLDELQAVLRDAAASSGFMIDYHSETFIVTEFYKLNPDASLSDLKTFLQYTLTAQGILPTQSSTLWSIGTNMPYALWITTQDFKKHNRTTIGPTEAEALAHLDFAQKTLTLIRQTMKYGYSEFSLQEFVTIADKISLIYDLADVYGNAILRSITDAFTAHPGDDEAAILAFITSLAKYSPDLKTLVTILNEHSTTVENLFLTVLEGLYGLGGEVLERRYLGEGGMRSAVTPLVIVGEVLVAVLQTQDISSNYLDRMLNVWPLKSSDGVAFIPTYNGVYFYEPGAAGSNLKYYANDYAGGINAVLTVTSLLSKTKIPYLAVISNLINIGSKVYSMQDSFKYASKATLATPVNYSSITQDLTSYVSQYLHDWLLNNPNVIPTQDEIKDIVTDLIDKEVSDTPGSPPIARVLPPNGGNNLKEREQDPSVQVPRSGGAARIQK